VCIVNNFSLVTVILDIHVNNFFFVIIVRVVFVFIKTLKRVRPRARRRSQAPPKPPFV
jgi:large-conductance mechanosensitive channel